MEIFNKQPGFIRWNRSPGNDPTIVVHTTVEGKNPANQLRLVVEIPLFTRFSTSLVVQDFFHQQYY